MFQKLFVYIKIIRPVNVLITIFTVFVAGFIARHGNSIPVALVIASITGGLVCAAGNVINDIYDKEIDKINRPSRPLPSGRISITEAWRLYSVFNLLALVLSLFINTASFVIVIVTIGVLFLYSKKLKRIIIAGNITVASLTGLAFIFGGAAVGNFSNSLIPAVFALLINLIREIVKDMEDVEGDYANKVVTFSKKYGTPTAAKLILMLTMLLIAATIIPFIIRYYKIEYFISVMIAVNVLLIYFLKLILKNQSKTNLRKASLILKLNMLFGLFSIYLGV